MQDGLRVGEEYLTHVTLVREDNQIKMTSNVCQHFKFGFCKFKNKCNKDHKTEEICINRSSCKTTSCNKRHPKVCTRFTLEKYCRFGDKCSYFHGLPLEDELAAAIKPYEQKIEQLEFKIENMTLQLNHFCSLTQEVYEKISEIGLIKSQITQLGNMIYSLEDKMEEVKNDDDGEHTDKRESEESSLSKSITELKSDIEDLRTLNQETHCRIRNVEDQIEEMQIVFSQTLKL